MRPLPVAIAAVVVGTLLISAPAREPERVLAFRDVDVFDGSRMLRRTTVLVRDGMIRAVGANVTIPPSAQVIDGRGKTLLPGLFDAHTHLGVYQAEQFLRDALDFGVTTELEMWGSAASLDLKRSMVHGGYAEIADLRTAGTGVTAPRGHPTQMGGPPIPTLAEGDDAQTFVDARIAEGADFVKVIYDRAYPTLTTRQLEEVVAAAHRRDRLVVVHVSTQSEARDAIAAGADGLAHIFADSPPDPDFADFAAEHGIFVIATLSVLESAAGAAPKRWWDGDARVAPYITTSMRGSLERAMPPAFAEKVKLPNAEAAVAALRRAGVRILAGTDTPAPGLAHGVSLHRELELLVRSGLAPVEALAAATSAPARAFGFHDRGRVAVGLRADLLLVNGDPSVDITATRDIVGIWKLGVSHVRRRAEPSR
jgi:imidazolonepropionase-like amidohydrolase